MSVLFSSTGPIPAPFPGLRAFDVDEALLFYGRERHVVDLLDRLSDSRFVAVTGTSGSGKSSLVRAGLRPALQRGYLIDATSRWRFAVMRPGGAPLEALAHGLAEALGSERDDEILKAVRASSAGLTEVVARAGLAPGESLLIVADQFEELFRFDLTRDQQASAALFVSALLEATEQRQTPIYVVLTMRSEFLGRCPEFSGLAEACNRSQYLVPRLTRDERQEAIERPLRLFDTIPTPALVQQVLNDAGDDPDLLPVLQHVMLRTYNEWVREGQTGRLEQRHYLAVGGIERALDLHGDEILIQLGSRRATFTERVFKSLTVVQNGMVLRRPRRMRELYDVVGATTDSQRQQVQEIVTAFSNRTNSFLMLSSPTLEPDTVVDITHESLIRKWRRLHGWVREEARSAEWIDELLRDVKRQRAGEGSMWQDPQLATALRRQRDDGWTEAWANQYRRGDDPTFGDVLAFLDASVAAQVARRRTETNQKHVRAMLVAVGVVIVVGAYFLLRGQARQRALEAENAQLGAKAQEAQAAMTRLTALEAEQAKLRDAPTASPQDGARLQQLAQEIEVARVQSKQSQDELTKLREDQQINAADRAGLIKQIDSLRQQLTQVTAERDKAQFDAKGGLSETSQAGTSDDRITVLTRQLEQERGKTADATKEIARLNAELEALRAGATTRPPAVSTAPTAASPTTRRPGETFRDCAECPEMVVIPAGTFRMGSPASEDERQADEGPLHSVTVRSFALGKYEVTRAEFENYVNATRTKIRAGCFTENPKGLAPYPEGSWQSLGFPQTPKDPVVCVSWDDVSGFTKWLAAKTKQAYRLPSEAEWEYAARAGTTWRRFWGDGADQACGYANVADRTAKNKVADRPPIHACDDGYAYTAPPGQFSPNRFGLYDMVGNVWEWTQDCYAPNYTIAPANGEAWTIAECRSRVLRGGAWGNSPSSARSANRLEDPPDARRDISGFRVARTLP